MLYSTTRSHGGDMAISIFFSSGPSFGDAGDRPVRQGRPLVSGEIVFADPPNAVTTDQDRTILDRLRNDDETALNECHTAYWSSLLQYAIRHIDSRALAEEIVQDVFLALWNRRQTLVLTGSLRAYLFGAVYRHTQHVIRTEQRARQREVTAAVQVEVINTTAESADAEVRMAELEALVQETIAKFPDRCKTIFFLYQEDELSITEIAQTLGIAQTTVRVQVHRAMNAIWQTVETYLR